MEKSSRGSDFRERTTMIKQILISTLLACGTLLQAMEGQQKSYVVGEKRKSETTLYEQIKECIRAGAVARLQALLEGAPKEVDLDARDDGCLGNTLLHCATCEGQTECVKLLLAFGASPDGAAGCDMTPLGLAVAEEDHKSCNLFFGIGQIPGFPNPKIK